MFTPMKPSEFMRLPLPTRRRIMKQQAASMVTYYENTADERELWQGGDFIQDIASTIAAVVEYDPATKGGG